MKSIKLDFDKLNNTRDLGDLETKDGKRIKKNKLIRSGHLYGASENDITKLSKLIEFIVDFRSLKETVERADPKIEGVASIHLPAIRDFTQGITREQKVTLSLVQRFAESPEDARKYMIYIYKGFVTDEQPLTNYRKFVESLLEKREKATLWHCTAGKDRAGFATVIVQELLGIDKDTIFEDYLYTNECIKDEVSEIAKGLEKKYMKPDCSSEELSVFYKTIDYLFGAKEEYLSGVYQKIEEVYGDFNGFISNGLKITDEQIALFRKLYIE